MNKQLNKHIQINKMYFHKLNLQNQMSKSNYTGKMKLI